jgi:NTP pyrophosphatase (non-canonical NTP hydrolase)
MTPTPSDLLGVEHYDARVFLENIPDIDAYQAAAISFAIYPKDAAISYPTLGLCGEAGEVAEKVKKHIRDGRTLDRAELAKELGDVLWYLAVLADDLGLTLSEIADINIRKLMDRKTRGVISGSGDNR